MKKYLILIIFSCVLFFTGLIPGSSACLYGQENNISIIYQGVKNGITIKDSKLSYSWHGENIIRTQTIGPQTFVGESAECQLTEEQFEDIKKWADINKVFELKGPKLLGDLSNPDFAYRYSFSISLGNKHYNLQWTKASIWESEGDKETIQNIMGNLKALCEKFLKENK